jgi:DnaJ-class molecular chaperone
MSLLLLILGALAAYTLFVLASPATACRTCSGWGMKQRRRRRAACPRCGGTGIRFRPGAPLVHRAAALRTRWRRSGTETPIPPWRPPRNRP